MKNICLWSKKANAFFPECYLEWTSIFDKKIVSELIRRDCLVLGLADSHVQSLFLDGHNYSIRRIGERLLGSDDEDDVREFSEKEVRPLTISECGVAKEIGRCIGLKYENTSSFVFGGNGYYLGEFGNTKTRFPVYVCFDFVNFDRELSLTGKSKYSEHPIVFAYNPELIGDSAIKLLKATRSVIFPFVDAFQITENGFNCLIPMEQFMGIKIEKAKQTYKTYDRWVEEFPPNTNWKDVGFVFDWNKNTLTPSCGNIKYKPIKILEINFFSDTDGKMWKTFMQIIEKSVEFSNPTQRRYVSELNRLFNSFFDLKGSAFSSRANGGYYKNVFRLTNSIKEKAYRKNPKEERYNEAFGKHNQNSVINSDEQEFDE